MRDHHLFVQQSSGFFMGPEQNRRCVVKRKWCVSQKKREEERKKESRMKANIAIIWSYLEVKLSGEEQKRKQGKRKDEEDGGKHGLRKVRDWKKEQVIGEGMEGRIREKEWTRQAEVERRGSRRMGTEARNRGREYQSLLQRSQVLCSRWQPSPFCLLLSVKLNIKQGDPLIP